MQMNNSHLAGSLLPALVRTPRPNVQIPLLEALLLISLSLLPWWGEGSILSTCLRRTITAKQKFVGWPLRVII